MHWIDWSIVWGLLAVISLVAFGTRIYMRSVADFLAANRCAGRYIICVADGMADLGAVTFIFSFEMYFFSGFSPYWWSLMTLPISLIIALSGWVIYRYRQTRAMTLAQFLETRYSKKFRIFAGILASIAGLINFGIFPAVGARFFVYYCGLPETAFSCFGIPVSSFVIIMAVLLSISLFYTFSGGQITIIVTDFLQGLFCNIVIIIIIVTLLLTFGWPRITEGLMTAPPEKSMLHPFHAGRSDFDIWYWLIGIFGAFYNFMAWQGNQGFNCSAKTPHEARMARVLGSWRSITRVIILIMLPVTAYAVMNDMGYRSIAETVNASLSQIQDPTIKGQVTVPIILRHILPVGLMGMFCAVMLAAFISSHNTYLHSWGSIIVQDVILPLRKNKRLSPEEHIRYLRISIIAVAIFIFFFSLIFRQTQYILLYFAITGAIWLGGAGSVIIGGLYWKKGTTLAAWFSLISGSFIAVTGMIVQQIWPIIYGNEARFPINSQWIYFVAMICSVVIYVLISVLQNKNFDIDQMLHRGKYALAEDRIDVSKTTKNRYFKALGITSEFTFGDKVIFFAAMAYSLGWWGIFLIGSLWNVIEDVPTSSWSRFWHFKIIFDLILGILVTVWFAIGGIRDLCDMFRTLKAKRLDAHDDGVVGEIASLEKNTINNEMNTTTIEK